MAVARLGAGAGGSSTGAAVTFNSFNITSSDANTVAIVGVVISVSTSSTSTTCAVTYGGTAMTQLNLTLAGSGTSRSAVGIYYLFNPGTGTQSVVVTPGGSSTKAGVQCQMVGFSGVGSVGAAQTAAATSHSPTSTANGYDVRVLGNGATLTSPNQTQEYLNGASVGGVGDWMAMQSAAGTGSTISFTCSGTATTPQSVATALSAPLPATETLTDDFTTKDTTKWTWDTGTDVNAGQARLQPAPGELHITSNSLYTLVGSFASVQVAQVTSQNTGLIVAANSSESNALYMNYLAGTGIRLREFVGGSASETTITYDAVAHQYWQIRESGGTVFWETSPTGAAGSWTTQRSKSSGNDYSSIDHVRLYADSSSGTQTALFDNFNIAPAATGSTQGMLLMF